jgi:hypothetical protein
MGWSYLGQVEPLANARAAVLAGEHIFAAGESGHLWRVAISEGGEIATLGESGWQTRLLASAGGRLFAFDENGTLYEIDPVEGGFARLDRDWSTVRAACAVGPFSGEPHDEIMLVAAAGHLFVIEPGGAGWHQLGEAEYDPKLLLGDGESLYSVEENGSLYRIDPKDGSWEQLDGSWGDVCAGAARKGGIFLATESGTLYVVGKGGAWAPVAEGAPPAAKFLFLTGRRLYALEGDGGLSVLDLA